MTASAEILHQIKVGGTPLTTLYGGWKAEELFRLSDAITCVILYEAASGRSAVWYLNSRYDFSGAHIEVVTLFTPNDVLACVARNFEELAQNALMGSPREGESYVKLPAFLAFQLSAAWVVRHFTNVSVIPSVLIETDEPLPNVSDSTSAKRKIARLRETRISTETLIVLSPFSDAPLRSQISFIIHHLLVHRFFDKESDAAFYLVWPTNKLDQAPQYYHPRSGLIIADDEQAGLLPARLLSWYSSHPEHVELIKHAQSFEAEDFGLGHTSKLLEEDAASSAPTVGAIKQTQTAEMISKAWAFLEDSQEDILAASQRDPSPISQEPLERSGDLSKRLRSLFRRH